MRKTWLGLVSGALLAVALPRATPTPPPPPPEISAPLPNASDMRAVLAAGRAPTVALEAEVADATAMVSETSYPAFRGNGTPLPDQNWRIVEGTGNCCENYIASTSTGRLFDFGGDYLYFSDDEGGSWRRVEPADPLPNYGEGAVAVAPNGDIVGVAWNPYYGDRLVPFKYEAAEERWYYSVTKLHQPFFDREALAALPGPFQFAGETYPYIVLLKGGTPAKDPWLVSLDGLNYFVPSARFMDQMTSTPVRGALKFVGTPAHDWLQTTYQTHLTALGPGQAIGGFAGYAEDSLSRPWGLLDSSIRWSTFAFDGEQLPGKGNLLSDSKARLHYVVATQEEIIYKMTVDGGSTWITHTIPLPDEVEGRTSVDFRANGALDLTAITAHVHFESGSKDFVYKLSTKRDRIRLTRIFEVGDGQLITGSGVASTDPRFDFSTITLLPDGRIALSFIDGEHTTPALAIEMP